MPVTISDNDFNRILSCVGYPAIPISALEFTETEIKDIFIDEALEYYFSRFPLTEMTSQKTTSEFEIDFPDSDTIGVVDARVNRRAYGTYNRTSNPFMNETLFNRSSESTSLFGINSFQGMSSYRELDTRLTREQTTQAMINLKGAQRINVEIQNRRVSGYVTTGGELMITWAKKSTNWDDVPYKDRQYVTWYAQSIILDKFIGIRRQAISNQGVDFDTSKMEDDARRYREDAMAKWNARRPVVILRN